VTFYVGPRAAMIFRSADLARNESQ